MVAALVAVLSAACSQAVDAPKIGTQTAIGTINFNGKKLQLKSAVAFWDAQRKRIEIDLLPFEPTPDQIAEIKKYGTSSGVVSKQQSPDSKTWAWCPHATLHIRFSEGSPNINAKTVTNYGLSLFNIVKQNQSENFSISAMAAVQDFKQLTVKTGADGVITLRLKNAEEIPAPGWENASYDFTVSSPLWATP